jgi:hypothetical protein
VKKQTKTKIKGENKIMGLTCKPVGKMGSIFRKLDNELAEQERLEKGRKKTDKNKTDKKDGGKH